MYVEVWWGVGGGKRSKNLKVQGSQGPFFCRKFHIIYNHYGDVVDEKNAEVVVVVGVVEILL